MKKSVTTAIQEIDSTKLSILKYLNKMDRSALSSERPPALSKKALSEKPGSIQSSKGRLRSKKNPNIDIQIVKGTDPKLQRISF